MGAKFDDHLVAESLETAGDPFAVGRGLNQNPGTRPGTEHRGEPLGLGPDAPLDDLTALGEDVDLAVPLVDVDAISESAGRSKSPDRGSPSRRRTPSVVEGTSRSLATRSRRSHLFAVTRHEEIPEACRNQYVELLMSSWHRRADASVDDTGRGPLWGPRLRFSIWLFLGEDPISGFGQV